MFSIQSRYDAPAAVGDEADRAVSTTSIAGFASSSMRQNHCSEISGSIRSPERCEKGTECVYGSSPRSSPRSRSSATTASCASAAVSPRKRSGAASVIRPSSPITLISSSSCRAADLEVVGIVTGRDLERAGAELGIDVLVGDDRQPALDQRQDRVPADDVRVALVVRVARRRRCRRASSPAAPWRRHHLAPALERVVDLVEGVGDLAVLDLEVGDRRVQSPGPS